MTGVHLLSVQTVAALHVPSFPREREAALYEELRQAVAESVLRVPLIAVIIPVLRRPHRVRPLVQSFRDATAPDDARLYFIAQRSDLAEIQAIREEGLEPLLVEDIDRSWARKINRGYERTIEPWLLLGADDLAFHKGWVDAVRPLLASHQGVIGTNDLGNSATMQGSRSTHPLVRREYARILGTVDARNCVVHDGYDHNFPDTELTSTARARGLYTHAVACIVEHLHPLWGKAPRDAIYVLGNAHWHEDRQRFLQRSRTFGFGGL